MITIPNRTDTSGENAAGIIDANMRQIAEDAQRENMNLNGEMKKLDKSINDTVAKIKQQMITALNEEVEKLVTKTALPDDVKALFNDNLELGDGSCKIDYNGSQARIGLETELNMLFMPGGIASKNNGEVAPFNLAAADFSINGVPILDSGSNAYGNWVRLYDGTQIVWRKGTYGMTASNSYTASGCTLFQGVTNFTFPVVFVGDLPAALTGECHWGTSASWCAVYSVSLDNVALRIMDIVKRDDSQGTRYCFAAIGRWK